ncbi:MAG TPA: CHASE2 domain-containing protein, partial [Spirochaetota bacterium]|nr:CHASE2 domain-containing protein [Spirochaetota bacterium]
MSKQSFLSQNNFIKLFVISLLISTPFLILYCLFKKNVTFIEYGIYDSHLILRNKIKGNEKIDYNIINLVIDDTDVMNANILNYRIKLKRLLDNLSEINVKSVLIDIIFPEESDKNVDKGLINSVKNLSKVYLPYSNIGKKNIFSFNELQRSIYKTGYNNITLCDDGILRDIKLFNDNETSDSFFISFKMACDYLSVDEKDIVIKKNNILLKNAMLPSGIKKNIEIPLRKDKKMALNYAGIFNKSFNVLKIDENDNLSDIKNELTGSIIIISNIKLFNNNIVKTPFEKSLYSSFIHSYLINSIITNKFIHYIENPLFYIFLYIALLILLSLACSFMNIDKIVIGYLVLVAFIIFSSYVIFTLFNVYFNIIIIIIPLSFIFIVFLINKYFNEKLNNFLFYIVTHDMKNDLYNITLNSKIMEKLSNQEKLLPHIETIKNSSEKLFDFFERIIRLLKLKKNRLILEVETINLTEIIKIIIEKY